jgi:23S rRNA (adenine2503-C2)-methyltransferase
MSEISSYQQILDPRQFSPKVFINKIKDYGVNPKNALRLLGATIGERHLDPNQWSADGIITKEKASTLQALPSLKLEKIETSKIDNFQKLLFRTNDGMPIETVIIPLHKAGAVSVCLSSQVGCVMGCAFCATAKMQQRRNLETWEIVDQMQQARAIAKDSGRRVTGAVFMGMGEPFLNYQNVIRAAEIFCYPVINAISAKAITISTVGVADKIEKFIEESRQFRLSISLGAAIDQKRSLLVPVASRIPVSKIIELARKYSEKRNERIMLSYVCVPEVNMFPEDVDALCDLIKDTKVRLDLIEVRDTSGRFRSPTEAEFTSFRSMLCEKLKQPVVRRYSGGLDINAACGTLAGK